jgi:hypothetical protein
MTADRAFAGAGGEEDRLGRRNRIGGRRGGQQKEKAQEEGCGDSREQDCLSLILLEDASLLDPAIGASL